MLHRRRQEESVSLPRPLSNGRGGSEGQNRTNSRGQSSILARLLGITTSASSTSANTSTQKRLLYVISPFVLIVFFLHLLSPDSNTTSSYGRGRSLPGFASRSQFAASRRTDMFIRSTKRQRTAAALSHGATEGYASNFSEPAPFTFCPTYGPNDELSAVYGAEAILKTRAHLGSSERVKKVIKRAMAGLPITIGILGGSVSSCHGLDATMAHPLGNPIGPNCYPHRLFSWLNDVFPHPANELTNGAR